jgi:hypothetical protein
VKLKHLSSQAHVNSSFLQRYNVIKHDDLKLGNKIKIRLSQRSLFFYEKEFVIEKRAGSN